MKKMMARLLVSRSAGSSVPLLLLALTGASCAPSSEGDNSGPDVIGSNDDDLIPVDTDVAMQNLGILAPTPRDNALRVQPPAPSCGNGELDDGEQCDDGGTESDDGCSSNCLIVEQGYDCPVAGAECQRAELCGDALLTIGQEGCDDGNDAGGDGCSSACQLEANYLCPQPGDPCISQVVCGDGLIAGDETCDDTNTTAGDGCSDSCLLEEGYACPIRGALCVSVCGDGLLRGLEQCDDGNVDPEDGCDTTCGRETGFACGTPGAACALTTCGDRIVEGDETCDDGPNDVPFDSCFQCVQEPACDGGECEAVCGDGLRFDSEGCDDGNDINGDGCSSRCTVEAGFRCSDSGGDGAGGDTFVLPVIYRDFIGLNTTDDGVEAAAEIDRVAARAAASVEQHPDFNTFAGTGILGAVGQQLGDNGKPVFACEGAGVNPLCATNFSTEDNFNQWYRDTVLVNQPIVDALTLDSQNDGSFLFDSAEISAPDNADGQFNPLLGVGWTVPQEVGNLDPTIYEGEEFCAVDQIPTPDIPTGGTPRNMSFTTESRFVFEYQGGESFAFSGDDDVWVYVNGQLVVDLGGLHEVADGEFTLSAVAATQGRATVTRTGPQDSELTTLVAEQIETDMVLGEVYEVALFHAERAECGSNFKLTLAGFDKPKSTCIEVCGDGVVTRSESCDDGDATLGGNNGAGYGFCNENCTPGPRCGDNVVEEGEEACDNGFNIDRYAANSDSDACGPGCTLPSFCGDGVVDSVFTEECDDGPASDDSAGNNGSYNGCTPECKLGPRCGDGEVNGEEECDDQNRTNGDGCNVSCEIERVVVPA